MPKFRVLVTKTVQKYYEVKARNQAEALGTPEYGKPINVKERYYKSIY